MVARPALLLIASAIASLACGRGAATKVVDGGSPPDASVPAVTPQAAVMRLGDSVRFTATVRSPHTVAEVRWTSSDSVHVTVSTTGLARATGVPVAGTQICARYADGSMIGCATIVVPAR